MDEILYLIAFFGVYFIQAWWREVQRKKRKKYYNEYLKTEDWQIKRYVVLKRDNWTCVKCGADATQVHHKKYAKNIGKEPIKWLISVCKTCHEKLHSKLKFIQ